MEHYLDNAATTAVLPCARDAAVKAMEEFGNPGSLHAKGTAARKVLDDSRKALAAALGCKASCVTFTSGGSESTNTALRGAVHKNRHLGRHIVSTQIEHDATLNTLKALQTEGFQVVAATEHSRKLMYDADLRKPTVIVMGSEEKGISKEVLKLCDEQLAIPMIGAIESLNVAAAAAIMLFEVVRQRIGD